MCGKLWWLFKVSCRDMIKYGWDILTVLLAAVLIAPIVTGDVSLLCTAICSFVLVVIFVILLTMYMMQDEWVIEKLKKK